MRLLIALLLLVTTTSGRSAEDEQVVILGDSLSKEYEFSFRFDGFSVPGTVRNWIEVLHAERNESFDTGARRDLSFLFLEIFFRHEYNWAVPGARIDQISAFLRGELGFLDFFTSSDPTPFEQVISAIGGLIEADDFDVDDLDDQIRDSAERVVLFIGGNDANEVYREIYDGDPGFDASAWIDAFLAEARFIMDWVLERNPAIEFVVVAVPHVGITPDVKSRHPTDPVKTARVTSVMRDLNRGLRALARERRVAFADIFERTLPLLEGAPTCIHGVSFINDIPPSDTDPGSLDYVWLDGLASAGFHPNTNAQLVIANEIVRAFNAHYAADLAPLTATEMLEVWSGKDPDVSFAEWLACHGLSGAAADDDRDRDGLPALLEFGVGADPLRSDAEHLSVSRTDEGDGAFLEIAYPLRLPETGAVSVQAESSGDGGSWTAVPGASVFAPGPDGRWRARVAIAPGTGFLRLRASVP